MRPIGRWKKSSDGDIVRVGVKAGSFAGITI